MTIKHFDQSNETASATPHFNPFRLQRILLVAGDFEVSTLNAEGLREAGYHVSTAANGIVAWDAIQVSNFDLVITDQFLPGFSGVELIQKIYDAHLDLPVIMATGLLPTWEFILHPGLNSITMLKKPYTTAKLLSLVEIALDKVLAKPEKVVPASYQVPSERQEPRAVSC
jgi:DNA-binding NtrC family response regulator